MQSGSAASEPICGSFATAASIVINGREDVKMKKLVLAVMLTLLAFTSYSGAKEKGEAKVSCDVKCIRLREGVNLFGSGHGKPNFASIPKEFEGRKITLRAAMSAAPLEFEVEEAGTVSLVTDFHRRKLEGKGWEMVDEISFNASMGLGTLYILQKKLDVGEYSIPSSGHHGVRLIK